MADTVDVQKWYFSMVPLHCLKYDLLSLTKITSITTITTTATHATTISNNDNISTFLHWFYVEVHHEQSGF